MHRGLQSLGHDSHLLVADNRIVGDSTISESRRPGTTSLTAKRALRRLTSDYLWRKKSNDHLYDPHLRFALPSPQAMAAQLPFKPDVVVAYWVNYFVHDRQLRELSEQFQAPIFWYLMDMAPITGGCHYAFDCKGYQCKCGNCPGIASDREHDLSRRVWEEKQAQLQRTPLVFLAASSQLSDQLKEASISRDRPMEVLRFPVSPEFFAPKPQGEARKRLEVPEDSFVIFFGAQHLHEKRKGIDVLMESLYKLSASLTPEERSKIFLFCVGNGTPFELPFDGRSLGFLSRESVADAFQAADVYTCPSIEESGPLMISESLMSGTPIVCFEMGIGRDLVHNGQTGYRARLGDTDDMAFGFRSLFHAGLAERIALRRRCRKFALNNFHPEVAAQNLVAFGEKYRYESLLAGRSKPEGLAEPLLVGKGTLV